MNRVIVELNTTTEINFGNDHALGRFIDVTDCRYANSGRDEQGEGYVLEWSELFGFGTNLIGATIEDFKIKDRINELVDKFIETL